MFSDVKLVVDFIVAQLSSCFSMVWSHGGWLGVGIICLALAARMIHIFKKILS